MQRANYIGTVALDFLDNAESNWSAGTTEDIIQQRIITRPPEYMFTLGSGVASWRISLATTPAFYLPTNSQFYLAGRHVVRWGGTNDPFEIDLDHYGFTPDFDRGVAVVWKSPKSEPHHLSEMPQMMQYIPEDWKEICTAVIDKKLL